MIGFPPAIVYLSKNLHSPDKLKIFFVDLERLSAGLMIMRADVNNRIDRYSRLLTAIEKDEVLTAPESPLQLNIDEQKNIVRTLHSNIYEIQRICQYVLLRLDSCLSQGEATYNHSIITVEHILPQNPAVGSKWFEWFPNEEERVAYVHRIGNLVLLSRRKNSEAQNFEFDKKKEKYFTSDKGVSSFALTTQVLQQNEWTPQIIEKRQAESLKVLRLLWRLGVVDGQLVTFRLSTPQ